jgi:hypothetical protein
MKANVHKSDGESVPSDGATSGSFNPKFSLLMFAEFPEQETRHHTTGRTE